MEKVMKKGIPERYKAMGFSRVGQKKKSTRSGKKWMVLAKKGDSYKVVHGGAEGMSDYTKHKDEKRRKRFWKRHNAGAPGKSKDPFSPLYWHKKFGTWEEGGKIDDVSKLGYAYDSPFRANPYLDIVTEEGIITMENTPVDLLGIDNLGNTKIMKAMDKNPYKFEGNVVREIPLGNPYQKGGMTREDLFNFIFDDEEEEPKTDPLPSQPEPERIVEQELRSVQNEQDQAMIDEILYSDRVSGNPYRRNRRMTSSPSDREMYTFNFFINKGYTPEQAAGITANIKYESNFDVNAAGDKGKAKGLAQWHPDRYSHLSSIFDMSSYDGNLEAIDYELNNKEKTAKSKLISTQKPEDAAFVFDKYFERSAGLSTKERMGYAKNLYNNYYGSSR